MGPAHLAGDSGDFRLQRTVIKGDGKPSRSAAESSVGLHDVRSVSGPGRLLGLAAVSKCKIFCLFEKNCTCDYDERIFMLNEK